MEKDDGNRMMLKRRVDSPSLTIEQDDVLIRPKWHSWAFGATLGAQLLSSCGYLSDDSHEVEVINAMLSSDQRTVTLAVGSCNAEPSADVSESRREVRIRVRADRDSTDDCADSLIVHLEDPLDNRRLIDVNGGTTGEGEAIQIVEF